MLPDNKQIMVKKKLPLQREGDDGTDFLYDGMSKLFTNALLTPPTGQQSKL